MRISVQAGLTLTGGAVSEPAGGAGSLEGCAQVSAGGAPLAGSGYDW